MANEKTLKTRVRLKIDTAEHWALAQNFSPLKGEMVVYSGTPPRIKVGDGTTNVNSLPFVDAAIYVGNTEPTGNYDVWIDTTGVEGMAVIKMANFVAMTDEEIDAICGATIYSAQEVRV